MSEHAQVYSAIAERLLKLLSDNLPYSLPLLRRLQFAKLEGGLTKTARIILVSEHDDLEGEPLPQRFSVAYLDIGGGPDTQMWVYSTVEKSSEPDIKETLVYERQLARLVDEAVGLAKVYNKELAYPGAVLLGTVHDTVRALLAKTGRIERRATGAYDKWLFQYQNIPDDEVKLPDGMNWGTANEDDCRVVISRTDIPRTV
ncbi:hypothetical protein ACHAPT_011462 [Fusarium lateritium]